MGTSMKNAVEELTASMMKADLDVAVSSFSSFKAADEDYVPTAFELIASEILDIIRNIHELHESASLHLEQPTERSSAPNEPKTNKSAKRAPRRGIKPSERSNSLSSERTPITETELMKGESPLRDGWDDLLDSVAEATNRVMIAHVVVETEDSSTAKSPPLFWLLYSGHAMVKSLHEQALALLSVEPASKQGLRPLDSSTLSEWCVDVEATLRKHGLNIYDDVDSQENTNRVPSQVYDGCPLERLIPPTMITKGKGSPDHCDIVDFTRWAADGLPPHAEKSVGRLQVIYLYRSKKAPFYHEYVVAGFGADGEVATSWVRLERAARCKDSLLVSGAHSLQSLFTDVEARETMFIAGSRAELCLDSNQLGAIVIHSPSSTPIYIRAVTHQAVSTINSNHRYQLFTTNCRWFSRRAFLNVLQWCESAFIPYTATWKGSTATAEHIRMKLGQERFGGSKLGDGRAKGLDHRNLLNLVLARTDWGQRPLTKEMLNPYIESLETASLPSDERAVLVADLLTKRSYAVSTTGDAKQALVDAERATALMRDLPHHAHRRQEQLAWSLAALSNALRSNGRAEDAVVVMGEVIELEGVSNSSVTAYRYVEQGINFRMAGKLQDAADTFAVAVKIFASVDRRLEWSDTRRQQINTLRLLAQTLDELGETLESLVVRQDILAICRDLPPHEETNGENRLISVMVELAARAIREGDFAEARATAAEATSLCRQYQAGNKLLSTSLFLCARSSHQLGDLDSAIESLTEAVAVKHKLDDDSSRMTLGSWYKLLATYWFEAENFLRALEATDDEISCYRAGLEENPADEASTENLAAALSRRGTLLRKIQRAEEAVEAYAESITALRPLSKASDRYMLQFARMLESYSYLLSHVGRSEDGNQMAVQSVSFYHALHLRSPSSEHRDILREALLRRTRLLTEIGASDEALEVASQAVQLGEHVKAEEGHISAILQKMLQEMGVGLFDEALATAERAVYLCETQMGERHDLMSLTLSSNARALHELGRHSEAAEKQEESIAIFREIVDLSYPKNASSLSVRLGNLSEYLQDAGLFERALASIVECVDIQRSLYIGDQTDEAGLSLSQSIVQQASILRSLDRRSEATAALAEETKLLRLILVDKRQTPPDALLSMADKYRLDFTSHSLEGRAFDAADALRQFLLMARLAFPADVEFIPEDGAQSRLANTLMELQAFMKRYGMTKDAREAILDACFLSGRGDEKVDVLSNGLIQILESVVSETSVNA